MREAFRRAGIPWGDCDHEDRGDGILILVPAELPKGLLVESLPFELVNALHTHNSAHPAQERIRLRMALHTGEVNYDDHGVTAGSINLAFRLLDSFSLKEALAGYSGVLAVITSSWFYEEVVRHSPVATVVAYHSVPVAVKETMTTGWICLPDQPYSPSQAEPDHLPAAADTPGGPPAVALRSLPADTSAFTGRAHELGRLVASVSGTTQIPGAIGVAGAVRPAEFSDLKDLIQGLSTGIQGELAKLDKRDKPPDSREAARLALRRAVRLAPRPVFLAGREELLTELDTRLAGDEDAGPRVVVLCGLGGAGKTSVALEYAHRMVRQVAVAWQFGSEDPAVLAAGFGELAAQLGATDGGDPVASVHGVLAASPVPWLLVFDNVPDHASVAPFVPPAGPGRVLITSRNQIWPPGQAVDVRVLDPEVAADFLVSRIGDADRRAALELAGELGGLPLALEQAAAYVQASGGSLAGYLASFLRRRADLLSRGEPTGYPETVATTWRLAFEDLQQTVPGAVGLLRLLAFCAPEAIPLRLLLQPHPGLAEQLAPEVAPVLGPLLEDELATGDAIAALRRYSLISPPAEGLVSVHRLVQAVTADQMPAELAQVWRQAAAAQLDAAIPGNANLPGAWPTCAALLPHAQAALDLTCGGMRQIASYLGHSGSYRAARNLFRLIAEAQGDHNAYGPEHPDTLSARGNLARWTGMAGDAAGACDQYAVLLPIQERVLGPEHPASLTTRGNLARWAGEAGDAAGACDQYAVLLPIQERVLGPEHPDTLTTRGNLARWAGRAGDPAGARDQYAALLPIQERILGPEHPGTLSVRSNLASWAGEAGDAAGARDQYSVLLPIQERILGPEHPASLTTRSNLANWAGEAGDPAGARDQYAALLPVRERVLGPEHPNTLSVRSNLASWAGEAGDAAGARDQSAALLPIQERVLGPEHPASLITRGNLARWSGEAGDAAGARDQSAALLPIQERVLGPEHPNAITTRSNLGYWTRQAETGSDQ